MERTSRYADPCGAEFIGGHLAESFLTDGHDVTVLDNFEPFYAEGFKRHTLDFHREVADGRDAEYRFVEGDVRDPKTVQFTKERFYLPPTPMQRC